MDIIYCFNKSIDTIYYKFGHIGRTYSTLISNFRHKVGVRFSTQFKCRRGTELAKRIWVTGISMDLVTYLVGVLNLPSVKSATIVSNVMGTLNLLNCNYSYNHTCCGRTKVQIV